MAKILLLEDVEYCLRFYRATLAAHGYTVVTAANAEEARRCCVAHPNVALIVAEAAHRDGKGKTAAEAMAARLPRARILYVSAYPLEHLLENGAAHLDDPHEGVAFLAKPFSARAFLEAVRGLLAGRAACA